MTAVRSGLVLFVIAGCGFQVTPSGNTVQDAGDGRDASDAQRDAALDAPVDSTLPPLDQDNDTVPDAQDNCIAVANPTQRNHDGDPLGDDCDRCPHLSSMTDPDGDNDGVGDACDPRPSTSGDLRVLWAGFYDTSEITGWTGQGVFTVSGGYLQQTSANTTGLAPPAAVNVPFVMTQVLVDNLINTNGQIGLAVTTSANDQFECTIAKTGVNVTVRASQLGSGASETDWTGQFGAGQSVTFRLDLRTDVDCRAIQGATDIQRVASTSDDPTGRTYVGMQGIAARFDYLFVVDQAP